jgi:O-methyltransferase
MNPEIEAKLALFGQRALNTPGAVRHSYETAEQCIKANVPGDFVECGVAYGTQIAAMALANQTLAGGRKVHLFDSFEGIPQPGPMDGGDIRACLDQGKRVGPGLLVSTGIASCSAEDVQGHMAGWGIQPEQLIYHEGWFQDTLPTDISQLFESGIALLRLDGDLYESTKVCLRYLSPLVHKGGYVIIDDYQLVGCRRAVFDYLLSLRHQPDIKIVEDGDGAVWYRKEWQD